MGLPQLDPLGARDAREFRFFLQDTWGSILQGWVEGMDVNKDDHVSLAQMQQQCEAHGFRGNAKRAFEYLNTWGHDAL